MITVVNFAKGGSQLEFTDKSAIDNLLVEQKRGFVPRKMFLFSGCQPINMKSERYGYSPEGQVDRRDTEWVFKRYQVLTPDMFGDVMSNFDRDDNFGVLQQETYGSDQFSLTSPGEISGPNRMHTFWNQHDIRAKGNVKYTGRQTGGWDILNFLGL